MKKEEDKEYIYGGWGPIEDIKDSHVDAIAKFAISEYNKQNNSRLKFQTVVSGDLQYVSGINFRLVLDVSDGDDGGSKTYEVEVYEQAWLDSRVLSNFKPVN